MSRHKPSINLPLFLDLICHQTMTFKGRGCQIIIHYINWSYPMAVFSAKLFGLFTQRNLLGKNCHWRVKNVKKMVTWFVNEVRMWVRTCQKIERLTIWLRKLMILPNPNPLDIDLQILLLPEIYNPYDAKVIALRQKYIWSSHR